MNAEIAKTREYYKSLPDKELCDCAYCKNFYMQVKEVYPKIASHLEALGVDITKPFETSPFNLEDEGVIGYMPAEYVVFGSCPDTYFEEIDDVTFSISTCHPSTGVEDEEHFVLGISPINLKMLLPE
jgi:hypothetical protein